MRSGTRRLLPLAAAVMLAASGGVFAGDNAGVVLSINGTSDFSGVGAGDEIAFTVAAKGLVDVKNLALDLTFSDPSAFNLTIDPANQVAGSGLSFAPEAPLDALAALVPVGITDVTEGELRIMQGGGGSFGAAASGDMNLGEFTLSMADDYDGREVSVTLYRAMIGKGPADQDNFTADQIAITLNVNPPQPPPTVSEVDPATGSITGGADLTIIGENFQDGATVTIGGFDAEPMFLDETMLLATAPAGSEGKADVVVTNPDGQSATVAAGFTYIGVIEPTLTASGGADFSLDFSAVGTGNDGDGSDGEVTVTVKITDATGAAGGSQAVVWSVANNGAEKVYVVGGLDEVVVIEANGTLEGQVLTTGADGTSALTFDSEGDRASGSTSISVAVTAAAVNSEGTARDLEASFSATWDVAVAAELAGFVGAYNLDREVILEWGAVSQTNNLGWEVYRSEDRKAFVKVSEVVDGDGTSDQFRAFQFVDRQLPSAEVVFYYLKQIDLDGTATRSQTIEMALAPTDVHEIILPEVTSLLHNYPNPFNPETTIRFDLATEAAVVVTVYDITGQVVRRLAAGDVMGAGHYEVKWNGLDDGGRSVASGVYFYRLEAGTYMARKKMTLVQ